MKHFTERSNRHCYSYNNPTYILSFGMSALQINETNFNRLSQNSQRALDDADESTALSQAGKAAIEYGIAGLILYIDIHTQILENNFRQGELVELEVIKLLAYIKFSITMLEREDAHALKSIEFISDDHLLDWKAKEKKLLALANVDAIQSEVNQTAATLVDECFKDNSSNSYGFAS
ncbi:hypothetical protein ACD661_16470 [Legionella lytica]|uniref:Uncharacterized protein n=1 Tax=Legionella lytica TaxID=96232 RepID=A0ABW8DD85_9GAMM